jgi:hypothetical protein
LSIKSRTNLRGYKVTIQWQQNWLSLYVFGLSGKRYATKRNCPCQYESNLPAVVHDSKRCPSHHWCRSPQQWCRTPHCQSRNPRKREAVQSRLELCLCHRLHRACQSLNNDELALDRCRCAGRPARSISIALIDLVVTQPFIPYFPHVLPLRLHSPSVIKLFLNRSFHIPRLLIEYAPTLLPL